MSAKSHKANLLGTIVLYALTKEDMDKIVTKRSDGTRMNFGGRLGVGQQCPALVVGVNNAVDPVVIEEPKPEGQKMDTNEEGDTINPNDELDEKKQKEIDYLNLTVFLDGTDTFWRQSVVADENSGKDDVTPGTFRKI